MDMEELLQEKFDYKNALSEIEASRKTTGLFRAKSMYDGSVVVGFLIDTGCATYIAPKDDLENQYFSSITGQNDQMATIHLIRVLDGSVEKIV